MELALITIFTLAGIRFILYVLIEHIKDPSPGAHIPKPPPSLTRQKKPAPPNYFPENPEED